MGSVINSAHKLCIYGIVLRVGRNSLLPQKKLGVKASQWVRHSWNYLLMIPKPFHRQNDVFGFFQGYVIQKKEKKPSLEPDKPAEDIYT